MKTRSLFIALLLALAAGSPAAAKSDCHAVGERVAAEMGAQLARAVPDVRNGQDVCVVVVLQSGQSGERPRRTEVVVPQD